MSVWGSIHMSNRDWTGNGNSIYKTLGASNHTQEERETDDYYATDPYAIDVLIQDGGVNFSDNVLEPACGEGHLSKRLEDYGYKVKSMDLIDRGYGITGVDFLTYNEKWDGDIVTNPPYKYAVQFIEHAMDIIPKGRRAYMFLKVLFLESKSRAELFKKYPPKIVYVSSNRILCAKNGDFEKMKKGGGGAVAYAWFVFEKGYTGESKLKWINQR